MNFLKSKTALILTLLVLGFLFWQNKSLHWKAPQVMGEDLRLSGFAKRDTASTGSSSQNPSSVAVRNDKDLLLENLRQTQSCYQREDCDFPQTDPKAYDIAVGQRLKELLLQYRDRYGKDLRFQKDTAALAREFMKSEDHFVQEVSLLMLSGLPPSPENLDAILSSLSDTEDPLLVEQAMQEMKRYMGTSQEAQVHRFLQDTLEKGAVFSSEQAVQGVFSFINDHSYEGYVKLARSLSENSKVGQDLRALLEEYRRMRTGG